MDQAYFINRGSECYNTALANALVELGDGPMAEAVFNNFQNHPLVGPGMGVHIGAVTRLLSDLTEGKYEGTLYVNPYLVSGDGLEEKTRGVFPDTWQEILQVIQEEKTRHKVIRVFNEGVPYNVPAIFFIDLPQSGHAILNVSTMAGTDSGVFIDNGRMVFRDYSSLEGQVQGILEVRKS